MDLLTNYFIEYKKIDPSLKSFQPHIIFLPLISSPESNQLFQQLTLPENSSTIIESEDTLQITYHVHQNKLQQDFLVGSYTLMLNLCEKRNNYEVFLMKKKKIKHLMKEYSVFVILVSEQSRLLLQRNEDFNESEAALLASEFDPRFEKTIGIISPTIFNTMIKQKINFYQHQSQDRIRKIDELILHRLKFKLNNIFRSVESGYQEFLQVEKEYQDIQKLLKNPLARQAEMYRIIVNSSQNISASLDGEYVNIGNQYQGLTLKGMLSTMFNEHFKDIKDRYLHVIDKISLNHIKKSIQNNESFQGFISKHQFCYAFSDVISFLVENSSLILNNAYEVVIQGTLKSFKVGLRKFSCSEKIISVIREFLIGLKDQCCMLIEQVVETIIVEIYFNFDEQYKQGHFISLLINDDNCLSQVKQIGTDYYREVIQQVQSIMAKLFFSKFITKIQNNLQRTVMDSISFNIEIDFELAEKYVEQINNNYFDNMYYLKIYRIMTTNHVCQMYLRKNQQEEVQVTQSEPPTQKKKQTFKEKIKRFFTSMKKEENKDQQPFRRRIDFSTKKSSQRAKSPDSSTKLSQNQLERASLASQFMLNQNTIDSQVEKPLTVVEWLKITGNDELYKILPFQKLKVSLARGIPSGIRSSIWSQMTRVELIKHPLIKTIENFSKLRDSYSLLKSLNTPLKAQIEIDVKRTEQRLPTTDRKIYSQMLQNVLIAYSNWDQVVGYTQGMNFICVTLLLVYSGHLKNQEFSKYAENVWQSREEIEKNAFLTLVMIMKCRSWDEVLGPQMPKLVMLLDQFNQMFKLQFPLLAQQLEQTGFTSQIIVTHHIISILTSECPYLFSIRILDLFLLIGSEVVMETLRFMFLTCQAQILKIQEPNEYFMFVRNLIAWEVFKICQDELDKFYL